MPVSPFPMLACEGGEIFVWEEGFLDEPITCFPS
jgi:hypothetical protein